MQRPSDRFFNPEDLIPELRTILAAPPADPKKLIKAGIPMADPETHPKATPAQIDRRQIRLSDGENVWDWNVDSLRALFRGDKRPPVLGDYPEAYELPLLLLDLHALEISKFFGDRTDGEMREIYSALRRRPDGRSLGFVHDHMWRAAALVLGIHPLSQAEFEAIVGRLERSCRTFEQGMASRNYLATLRATLG